MIAINMTNKTGKVFITGAGPGDPGLITEKAKRALEKCDAVIYDHLVSLELIVPLPKKVERIYAGKSANRHTMKQEEINELLVKLAKEGKTVVRLKGGDPYIFGRGGEEALHLRENGVPFEIIPGITAGVAAPAYAGIPVTHRGKAVFAVFTTAHEAAEKEGSEIPWRLLAGSNKGTIVGYMGVKTLPDTIARLLQDITGGLMVTAPSAKDMGDPKIKAYLEKYLVGSVGVNMQNRMKMMRLIENLTLGSSAVGYLVESLHGAGSPQAQRIMILRSAGLEEKKKLARKLASIIENDK